MKLIKKLLIVLLSFSIFFQFWMIKNISFAWLDDPNYMIHTDNLWLWWSQLKKWNAQETVNNSLKVIVTKLMVAFWVLSLLIMTVWWAYIIFSHGQDELLSKWKSIFNAWIIALVIALASWIIMKAVIYLLY